MDCGALLLLVTPRVAGTPRRRPMAAIYSDMGRPLPNLVRRWSRSAGSAKLASTAVRVTPSSSASLRPKCSWAIAYSPATLAPKYGGPAGPPRFAQTEVLRGDRVSARHARAEVRRVVGAERERDPRLAQDREGVLLVGGEDPEDDVARRAHLERDLPPRELGDQVGV